LKNAIICFFCTFAQYLHNICTIKFAWEWFSARHHLWDKSYPLAQPEAVVRLVPEVEVGFVVLRGINDDHPLFGERNVDVKHADGEADDECRP
jgi:hypothetical protein